MTKQAANMGLLLSCLVAGQAAHAQEQVNTTATTPAAVDNTPLTDNELATLCLGDNNPTDISREALRECIAARKQGQKKTVETIEVTGRYIGLQVPEVEGRFVFDREFIESTPRTGGDFTELLGLLPGVILGDEMLNAEDQAEINAKRVFIGGNEAWQTGFFMDGMNFNSRQDPSTYQNGSNPVNDVEGSTQTFNINQQIIDSIEVYLNNIPAEYGSFSGGVVEVHTREPENNKPQFGFSYRTSQSDWNEYKVFFNETNDTDVAPIIPQFEKHSINTHFSTKISEHHSILLSANYIESEITAISLNQPVLTKRQNANILAKVIQKNLWVDEMSLTFNYSPYKSDDVVTNTLNGEFDIEGGGYSSNFRLTHGFDHFTYKARVSYAESFNSRNSPPHFYPWAKVRGKGWGVGDDTEQTVLSLEGGYGDLEKTQKTLFIDNQIALDSVDWLGGTHNIKVGLQYQNETLQRDRFYDSYIYNSPITGISNLQCSGYGFDCGELQTSITLEALEAQLGEPIDFTNPEHVLAYSNIVTMSPQYFALRTVYQQENIDVTLQTASVYLTNSIDFGDVTVNAGLRTDYDDFLENVNIAPRVSIGYRWFGDADRLLTVGLNRYYDSNLLTYKVREQQLPYLLQRREINGNGFVQGWQTLSTDSNYRFLFDNLDTPFNDEAVVGWKQATDIGNFSIEYTKRWRKDQLVQVGDPFYNEADGYFYRRQSNEGFGENELVSFAWSWQYDEHSFWFNTSYRISEFYSDNQEQDIDNASLDELVFLQTVDADGNSVFTESTRGNMERIEAQFDQPIRFNLGWTAKWTNALTTSLTGSFVEAYNRFVRIPGVRASGQLSRFCPQCTDGETLLVDVFEQVEVPNRFLVNLSFAWKPEILDDHGLSVRLDLHNVLDQRTYQVAPLAAGVETGRSIWLEIGYQWH